MSLRGLRRHLLFQITIVVLCSLALSTACHLHVDLKLTYTTFYCILADVRGCIVVEKLKTFPSKMKDASDLANLYADVKAMCVCSCGL